MFSSVAYLMLDHNFYQNLDNALRVKSAQLNAPSVIIPQSDEILLSFNYNGTVNQEIGTITVDTSKETRRAEFHMPSTWVNVKE
jgi:hypothetical protein